jgi:hypothetical protein
MAPSPSETLAGLLKKRDLVQHVKTSASGGQTSEAAATVEEVRDSLQLTVCLLLRKQYSMALLCLCR